MKLSRPDAGELGRQRPSGSCCWLLPASETHHNRFLEECLRVQGPREVSNGQANDPEPFIFLTAGLPCYTLELCSHTVAEGLR